MCQSLVQKVAQSKQLLAVADPGILELFENWLEELEDETMDYMEKHPEAESSTVADDLGLSQSGADFLLAKLRRGGQL
ncbi:MAG: hypothetical protein PHI06_06385 [Desulfobulbaceae bacterium]|nr:hypothetical protein [Desulfobulbaceae bacterium]